MKKLPRIKIDNCQSLDEVRNKIDALDEVIIPLLCERIQYVIQAAKFKEAITDTRLFGRIEAIVQRSKAYARVLGADEDYIESVYRFLIDESIRQEKNNWLKLNKNKSVDINKKN